MSTGTDEVGQSAPHADGGEEKQAPINEKHSESSQDASSNHKGDELDSDDTDGIRLVNDGNPFPPDPNAPEETAQLTVRAVLVGSMLGLIVGASNIYLGLKTGMHSAQSTPFPALVDIDLSPFVRFYFWCFSFRCYLWVRLYLLNCSWMAVQLLFFLVLPF